MRELLLHSLADSEKWDALVQSGEYGFFHSMAWGGVLAATYGFEPCYLSLSDGGSFSALPLMIVRSPLGHRRAVCLPFSDSCGPVYTSRAALDALMEHVMETCRRERWSSLQVRGDHGLAGLQPRQRFVEHTISLESEVVCLEASLRPSTLRNIRQSQRQGVQVRRVTSPDGMEAYFRLHCTTRKRQGVPPQPLAFFRTIQDRLVRGGHGCVLLAEHDGSVAAGAVFLHFGTKAVYKFGASLFDAERLRPNNLVMWEAIRWHRDHGFTELSLGRTEPENAGLLQFKKGWGGTCRVLDYCAWPAEAAHARTPRATGRGAVHSLARRMPVMLLRLAGSILYRYMG
jgi:CelD/BcsL family acetyltransferase involved in cellulose biosynthesis